MKRRDLAERVDELEQSDDRSVPETFAAWGREAGLDDDEIRAKWMDVVNATGIGDPIATAWNRSLQGELFDT